MLSIRASVCGLCIENQSILITETTNYNFKFYSTVLYSGIHGIYAQSKCALLQLRTAENQNIYIL